MTAYVTTPTDVVTSLNGVDFVGRRPLGFIAEADAVLVGSGIRTRVDAGVHRHDESPDGQYLAAWVISRTLGDDAARDVIRHVAPVGEKDEMVRRVMATIHAGAPVLN